MEHKISAGAVIFSKTSGVSQYLLLQYSFTNYKAWDFPRGAVETNEAEQAAAKREIREETGLTIERFDPAFREVNRWQFRDREGRQVEKQIVYFLAETPSEAVTLSGEHAEYRWLGYTQARQQLSFPGTKQILDRADQYIRQELIGR